MSGNSESMDRTVAVHGGERRPGPEGSVVFPIYQGTVYEVEPGTSYHDLKYIRLNSTPSQRYLHDKLAALEGAEAAVATSSGMAAVTTISCSASCAHADADHLLASDCLLAGGTHDFLTGHAADLGWSYSFVDAGRPQTWEAARTERTKVFLVETITNPLMRVGLLDQVADFGRREGVVTVIDNTFASPVNFRPLQAGFDVVFHSATKYLGGHSDLVAGAVMGSADLIERVRRTLNHFGGFRSTRHAEASSWLAGHQDPRAAGAGAERQRPGACPVPGRPPPRSPRSTTPGLVSHPDHAHASKLLSGFGGMLSLRLHGGERAAQALMDAVTLAYVAPSLGGVETLVTRPAATSHAGMSREDRDRLGITADLIRVSSGIEGTQDLIGDFVQALDTATA